jgi:uncharacterized protein YbbC (DUF1343 family)
MTDSQFMVLVGVTYLAPHFHPIVGNFAGALCITLAAIKGLGWL